MCKSVYAYTLIESFHLNKRIEHAYWNDQYLVKIVRQTRFTFIKLNLLLQNVLVFCMALWHCTIVFVFFLMITEFSCFRENVFVESRCCKMSLTLKWMAYYVSMIQMLAMKLLPWSLLWSVSSDYDVVCVETIALKGQTVCALRFFLNEKLRAQPMSVSEGVENFDE